MRSSQPTPPSNALHPSVHSSHFSPFYSSYNIKQNIHQQPPKEQSLTQASQNDDLHSYCFVEPLEFDTADFKQDPMASIYDSIVTIIHEEKNKRTRRIKMMVDCATQTLDRPKLQQQSEETDCFNCFDAAFNGGCFNKKDIVTNNVGIASKRSLTQWEKDRRNKWQ